LRILAFLLFFAIGCSTSVLNSRLFEKSQILRRLWTFPTHGSFEMGDHGTEFSNAVLADRVLIFGSRSLGLTALYPKYRQKKWDLSIKNGVVSELALDQESVYFGGSDGFLYSVKLETGSVHWKYNLKNPIISRPTLYEGKVFATTSDNTVYALEATTGRWLWHYRRRTSNTTTIYGASSPWVGSAEVIVGFSDGSLVTLAIEDGRIVQERNIHQGGKFMNVNAHPIVEEHRIYIPSYDGELYALKKSTYEILWKFEAGGSKNVVLSDRILFFPSSIGSVYAIQKEHPKVVWKFDLDRGTPTEIIVTEKYVIVGSSYQYLYVIDRFTGKGLYRFHVGSGSGFYGAPAFDPETNRIYVLSCGGNLYCFEIV
jgi:outer membrane protein assembly factor BamB